ncbi:cytochrome P450-like protein [Podospora australis]|uniref:Cytochrome P450-like protein n=1 Tax=Podospora australis TaxID=1536484 RepID=A0AAN6WN64_9PEZI|nr:cytochrome P450-like protein [Podospora australis]
MSTPIPQPPGLPVLGNIFDIDPSNTWWSLKTLAEKYGEIFKIKVLGHQIVFIASAALAEEICDEKRFRKYVGGPIVEIRYSVHDSLFVAYEHEESWGIHHRIVAPHLSPESTAGHFDEILLCTDELIANWKTHGATKFQPLKDLNNLNLEATTLSLFGKKLGVIGAAEEHPMIQAMEDATSEAMKRPNRPKLLNWLVYGGKFKKATKVMRSFGAEIVKYRHEHSTGRKDLLSALMNGTDPETGKKLTDEQVIDEIVTMPIGSSTAPCALTSLIMFLLENPEVVTRGREELGRVVGKDQLHHDHLDRLEYIKGVVRETLRLSQAAPGFNIEPIPKTNGDKSPVLLQGGKYQVAHNQPMIIVLAGVNRDPEVFDEPHKFKPERMIGENFERLPAGVKKWFGNGKRACIGKHWAWEFLEVVTAKLIKEIDFEVVDSNYVLKQDGWFNVRPIDFYVKAKARA